LFFLIFAVNLVPFQWVLGDVVLSLPVGDIAGYEGSPELGVFAQDLRGALLNLVQLFRGVNTFEDRADGPVFEGADIGQAYVSVSCVNVNQAGYVLRTFLMQALVHNSTRDGAGILEDGLKNFGVLGI
jgi:hypothetical protein